MNIYGGNDCLRISYIISLFGFFSIHHLFHDSVFDIKVLEQFFVIAGVICIRHNIDVEFDFCFSRRENISVDPDTVSNQTDVFYAVICCPELFGSVLRNNDMRTFINDDTSARGLYVGDKQGSIARICYCEHDIELLPLFDGVIMPVGVFYLYAGRTHFFSAR